MATITVDGLTKRFGAVQAVDDLSFEISGASVTGFLGPNGAGKTTTLRMLLGLVTPGRKVGPPSRQRRYAELDEPARIVGALLEATSFHPGRSARNHLRMVAHASRLPDRRADEVLDRSDWPTPPAAGSGASPSGCASASGWPRRCSANRRCSSSTSRPTGSTRPVSAGCVTCCGRMAGRRPDGPGVEPLLAEVAQTVDRVVVIDRGRLVADGPVADLTRRGRVTRGRLPAAHRHVTAGETSDERADPHRNLQAPHRPQHAGASSSVASPWPLCSARPPSATAGEDAAAGPGHGRQHRQ